MTTVLLPWPLTTTQSTPWLRVDVGTSTRRTRSVSLNRCGSNTTIMLWAEWTCTTAMPENMRFKYVARNGTGHTELDTSSSKGHSREGISEGPVHRQANLLLLQMQHHSLPSLLPPISHSPTLRQYKCHLRPASYI